jgi:beta-lactamase class D
VIGETTEDHRYIFPVTDGSYAPVQVQEISSMRLRRVPDHGRSRNRAAAGIGFLIVLLAPGVTAASSEAWTVRNDWPRHFAEAGVRGTLVVVDARTHPALRWVHDESRARTRFIPASTFKIPHALIALDAGEVRDEFQVFRWDGTRRDIESWNRDQDLRSSMRNSVVWVYQHFARSIGEDGERRYLQKIGYGNVDPSGGVDRFWLDGKLAISAEEQVAFLQRLYRNELPFRVEHQRLVKDVLVVEAGRDWILRAKTGWQARPEPQVGWWVGWVEWPQGPVFFALNIDMPNAGDDLPKREVIVRAALRSIGALPSEPTYPSGSGEAK